MLKLLKQLLLGSINRLWKTKGAPHLDGEFLEADYAKEWFSMASDMMGEPLV
jgi:hypothetical protein